MTESLEVKQYYIWDVTSLKGTPEIYLAENESLVFFESGRTVDLENFSRQLSKITEEEYKIANRENAAASLFDIYNNIPLGNPATTEITAETIPVAIEQNPILLILNKQKKLDETTISLNLSLKLPSKKVIEFLNLMFDEDDVKSTLSDFSIDQLDDSFIKESIKSAILNYYTDVS